MKTPKPSGYLVFSIFIFFVIFIVVAGWTLKVLNFPPMTGHVSSKTCHPVYYPATASTPVVYTLAITNESGNQCTTWQVSEDRWNLYEVGDAVDWFPRLKGDVNHEDAR